MLKQPAPINHFGHDEVCVEGQLLVTLRPPRIEDIIAAGLGHCDELEAQHERQPT